MYKIWYESIEVKESLATQIVFDTKTKMEIFHFWWELRNWKSFNPTSCILECGSEKKRCVTTKLERANYDDSIIECECGTCGTGNFDSNRIGQGQCDCYVYCWFVALDVIR